MTKLCICQICTCGRHRCPHNPRGVASSPQPCTFSEYANKYTTHPIEPRRSYKPEDKTHVNSGPMEDATTHRVDYIPHPFEKPFVRQNDLYKPPEGDMDMMTNYLKEFTQKPMELTKPIRRDDERRIPGKFEGEPTYAADYRQWALQPREKATIESTYQPPTVPFDANTNYQADFIPRQGERRQIMRPQETARQSDQPFDDLTDYKQTYVVHALQPREAKEKPVWRPNEAAFDDLSTHRRDFTPKETGAKTLSFKPENLPYQSQAPFEGDTTQKRDYVPWAVERPQAREQETYRKPEGSMDMNTTTHTDFVEKAFERQPLRKPLDTPRELGKFDGTTNYQTEYLKWAPAERSQPMAKEQYTPNDAPFEGLPTYRRDYIPHQAAMTRTMKPIDQGYSSNAPFDDGTEYKKEFIKKYVPPCPVPLVEAGTHEAYAYREQDDTGHKWYDVVANTTVAKA